jgi:hypothetical protein
MIPRRSVVSDISSETPMLRMEKAFLTKKSSRIRYKKDGTNGTTCSITSVGHKGMYRRLGIAGVPLPPDERKGRESWMNS